MNRKHVFFLVSFSLILVAGIVSCKKKASSDTSFSRLLGRWKLAAIGTDDNGDGIIEGYEINTEPSANSDIFYFENDSAGIETTTYSGLASPVLNFNWSLLSADSLRVAYSAHDTVNYYIDLLNSSNLVLATNITLDSGSIFVQKYYNRH
jgi:hypothetical protein